MSAADKLNIQESTPLLRTMSRFNSMDPLYYLGAGAVNVGCWVIGGYGIYSTITHRPIDGIKLALSIVTMLAPTVCTAACCAGVKPSKSKTEKSPSDVEGGKGKSKIDLTDLIDKVRKVVTNEKYRNLGISTEVNAFPSSKELLSQQIEILISLLAIVDSRAEQLSTTLAQSESQLREKARLLQEKERPPVQPSPAVDLDVLKKEIVRAVLSPISTSIHTLLSDSRFQEEAKGIEQKSSENLEAFVSRQITSLETLLETLLSSAQQSEQELMSTKADFEAQVGALETKLQALVFGQTSQSPATASPAASEPAASPAIQATQSPALLSPASASGSDLEALKRDIFAGISNLKLAVNSPSSRPGSRPPSAPPSPASASPAPRTPAAAAASARSSSLRNEDKSET